MEFWWMFLFPNGDSIGSNYFRPPLLRPRQRFSPFDGGDFFFMHCDDTNSLLKRTHLRSSFIFDILRLQISPCSTFSAPPPLPFVISTLPRFDKDPSPRARFHNRNFCMASVCAWGTSNLKRSEYNVNHRLVRTVRHFFPGTHHATYARCSVSERQNYSI